MSAPFHRHPRFKELRESGHSWTDLCDPMWQLRKGVPSWIDEYHPQASQGEGGLAVSL